MQSKVLVSTGVYTGDDDSTGFYFTNQNRFTLIEFQVSNETNKATFNEILPTENG
jgi:hypothetical protein